jgi:iron complex outermembrane receptor protein
VIWGFSDDVKNWGAGIWSLDRIAARWGVLLLLAASAPAADGPERSPEGLFFQDIPVVEAASLHTQTLEDAPANVTVIGRDEIRKYGYRTLAEALSNVRGFYSVFDGAYNYLGARGLAVPGDYTTRILIMINGHYMTDNVYNMAGYLGQDFGLDMDLVQRIEVIRGPSSALYGSNGVFATINIVTVSPVDHPTTRATTEVGTYGEKKVQVSSSMYLGNGANLLMSGSLFHDRGRSVDFGETGVAGTNLGLAEGVERQRGYHFFAQTVWHNWSFTALANRRDELVPIGYYGTTFNGRGTQAKDGRSFVEAAYRRPLGKDHELNWRVYYDRYRYWGRYDYEEEDATYRYDDLTLGHWVGSRLTYSLPTSRRGTLTFGGEVNVDLQTLQNYALESPYRETYLDLNTPDRSYGLFLQQELQFSPKWTAYLGARMDDARHHDAFVSPRLALLYKQSAKTTYKMLYGRSFRNPNAYEQFYGIADYKPNADLQPERAQTLEFSADRRFGERLRAEATVYRYWISDLIQNVQDDQGIFQFHNNAGTRALGAEFELAGRPLSWLETAGAFTIGRVKSEDFVLALVNSPRSTAQFRFSMPLATRKVLLSGAYRYLSSRRTVSGGRVEAAPLFDMTISTRRLHRSFDLVLGVRNVFDRTYFDPVGEEHVVDRFQRRGRTAFVKLVWQYGE